MPQIYLPTSAGMVDIRVWRLNEAANEYDPRLMVGRNEQNGAWAVFIKTGPLTPPHPVLHLGWDVSELPHPDDLKRKLYQTDALRNGEQILDRMNRHNEELKKPYRDAADQATELAAEALAWGHSRMTNRIGGKRISIKMGEKERNRRHTTR